MQQILARYPYLLCGLGQIRREKRLRGWILAFAFWDCVAVAGFFLVFVRHPMGAPIGLLCFLLAGLLWFYSYLDYLDLAPQGEAGEDPVKEAADSYEAGRISYLRGELETARSHFQKALKKNGDDWDALYQLARVQYELGDAKKAQRLFKRYTESKETRKWAHEAEEYLNEIQNRARAN